MPRTAEISRQLQVESSVRSEAVALVEDAHDRQFGGVSVTLEDGSIRQLPAGLANIIGHVIESIAADGTLTTGSLPEELTTTTAAHAIGVSRPTLMKLIARGDLPATKVGTHTRLRRSDVIEYRSKARDSRRLAVEQLRVAGEAFE